MTPRKVLPGSRAYSRVAWATDIDKASDVKYDNAARTWRAMFDSWEGFLAYATQDVPPGINAARGSRQDYGADSTFVRESWDEAVSLAREGWLSAVTETSARANEIAYKVIGDRYQRSWTFPRDVVGEMVDVGAYVAGEPECMIDPVSSEADRRGDVIRLVISVDYNGSVPEQLCRDRGAALIALIQVLQQAGCALEIWALVGASGSSGTRFSCAVQVQRATDPIMMSTIMYALAHPTMLRRLGFAAQERCRDGLRRALGVATTNNAGGYGRAIDPRVGDVPDSDGPTITMNQIRSSDDWSAEASEAWIIRTLDSLSH